MSRCCATLLLFLLTCLTLPVSAWGDVNVRVLRLPANTATGNQDFTIAGFDTPKGALVFLTYAVTDGTPADNAAWSIGAMDCTNQFVTQSNDRADGGATSDATRRAKVGSVALLCAIGSLDCTTVDGEATGSCITDGIRLNWLTALEAAYQVHVVLFGGSQMTTFAGTFTQANAIDGTVDVTSVPFTPEAVFCFGNGGDTWDGATVPSGRVSLGVGTPSAQGSVTVGQFDAAGTTQYGGMTTHLYACNVSTGADALEAPVELGSFDSQGFTATTRHEAHAHVFGFFAYTTGGAVQTWVGPVAPPATAISQAYTGPGWRPQGVLLFIGGGAAAESEEVDDDAGVLGLAILEATAQYSMATRGDDGAATVDTSSLSDNQAINVLSATGATRWAGTLTSLDATGWTLNFTTSLGAAAWYGWALQEDVSRRGGLPQWMR